MGLTAIGTLDSSAFVDDDSRRDLVFVAGLWPGDRRPAEARRLCTPLSLLLPSAFFWPIRRSRPVSGWRRARNVEPAAGSPARLVECLPAGAGIAFSDNYLALPARRAITVSAPRPAGWDLAMAQAALKVRSVYDTCAK